MLIIVTFSSWTFFQRLQYLHSVPTMSSSAHSQDPNVKKHIAAHQAQNLSYEMRYEVFSLLQKPTQRNATQHRFSART